MLQDVVHSFLERYSLLGEKLLCGFSGGADSTSLLLALSRENVNVTAVHFQHEIRGDEAEADAEWCRSFCSSRNIPLQVQYLDVPKNARPGECIEEAARRLRLESWKRLSQDTTPVFLAHHADDVLEELFLRLARGSNVAAIVPMKPCRMLLGMRLMRPLLKVRRAEIEAWLRCNGIDDWRIDCTNQDNEYRRNAVRNLMLPLFRKVFGSDAGLLRSIDNLSLDAAFIDEAAERLELKCIDDWRGLHPAMLYRAVRRLLEKQFDELPAITHSFLERLYAELQTFSGKSCTVPLNKDVAVTLNKSGVSLQSHPADWQEVEWNWAKMPSIELGRWQIQVVDAPGEATEAFDADMLGDVLLLRHRRAGDRMCPFGSTTSKKLQDIFVDAKIPRELRDTWPIIVQGDEIIWVPGVRRAQFAPIAPQSRKLYLHYDLS